MEKNKKWSQIEKEKGKLKSGKKIISPFKKEEEERD
jgi:hypothetical protein